MVHFLKIEMCFSCVLVPPGAGGVLLESGQVLGALSSCRSPSGDRAFVGLLVPPRVGEAHLLEVPSAQSHLHHRQGIHTAVCVKCVHVSEHVCIGTC